MSQGDPQYITYSTSEEEFRIHTEGCGCCADSYVKEGEPLRTSVAELVATTQEKLAVLLKVLTLLVKYDDDRITLARERIKDASVANHKYEVAKAFLADPNAFTGEMRFFARDLVEKIGLDALLAAMNTAGDNLTDVDREIVDVLQLIKQ